MKIEGLYPAIEKWLKADLSCEKAYGKKLILDEMMPYYHAENKAKHNIRTIIKDYISQWCETNQFENSYNRLDVTFFDQFNLYNPKVRHPEIILNFVAIFSSKGSIGSRPKWLNKISIGQENNIISHVARTDENYLGTENVERFIKFVVQLKKYIEDEVYTAQMLHELDMRIKAWVDEK